MNLNRLTYNLQDGEILHALTFADIKAVVNGIANAVEDIDAGGGGSSSGGGEKGDSPINCYRWFEKDAKIERPTLKIEEPSGWWKYAPSMPDNTSKTWYLWMSLNTKKGDGTIKDDWSNPIRISGEDGDNGTDNKSREWIYSYGDTGFDSDEGTVNGGSLPDGKNKFQVDDFIPYGWSDRALIVEDIQGKRTVYASWRDYNTETKLWSEFNNPVPWSHWGEQGLDGDGVQYIYKLYPRLLSSEELWKFVPKAPNELNSNKEWLPVENSTFDTIENSHQWTDDPETTTANYPFCYCSIIRCVNEKWGNRVNGTFVENSYGDLSLWANYSEGVPGSSPINCYKWFAIGTLPKIPNNNTENPEYPIDPDDLEHPWSKYAPDRETNKHLWMSSNTKNGDGTVTEGWSEPVRISGDNGDAGSDEEKREWIYNYSPLFDTTKGGEISPQGAANDIISRNDGYNANDWVPYGWYDRALPVSQSNKDVYTSWRDKNASTGKWEDFNEPFVWSHWGETGMDGDGVLYIYKLFPRELTTDELYNFIPNCPSTQNSNGEWLPENPNDDISIDNISNKKWKDNPETTSEEFPYCYCSIIKYYGSLKKWGNIDSNGNFSLKYSNLSLWSRFSDDAVVYTISCTDIVKPEDNYISVNITRSKGEDILTKNLESAKTDWKVYLEASLGSIEESNSRINLVEENITTTTSIILTLHKNSITGKVIAFKTIKGLKDGDQGKTGKMFYQAGIWDLETEYRSTDELCPIVCHEGKYYYLDFPLSKGEEPGVNAHWKLVNNFSVVMTEALFAQFAKLGSFIVSGDFFISQHGTLFNSSGAVEITSSRTLNKVYTLNNIPYLALSTGDIACYTYFDSSDPMVKTLPTSGNYKFRPMKVVNARTGEEWSAAGNVHMSPTGLVSIKGDVYADTFTAGNKLQFNVEVTNNSIDFKYGNQKRAWFTTDKLIDDGNGGYEVDNSAINVGGFYLYMLSPKDGSLITIDFTNLTFAKVNLPGSAILQTNIYRDYTDSNYYPNIFLNNSDNLYYSNSQLTLLLNGNYYRVFRYISCFVSYNNRYANYTAGIYQKISFTDGVLSVVGNDYYASSEIQGSIRPLYGSLGASGLSSASTYFGDSDSTIASSNYIDIGENLSFYLALVGTRGGGKISSVEGLLKSGNQGCYFIAGSEYTIH